jgi:hypothetical protein
MDLAAILAARKQAKPQTLEPPSKIEATEIDPDFVPYLASGKYLPNYEINPLFLACLTPLIRFPYQLYAIHNEYYWWLLSPDDNVHVLNTFPPISDQVLFSHYMQHNPPRCAHDLHKLYVTISRIQLNMPPIYLPSILELIKRGRE